jgi:hypothetical protein
MAGRFERDFAQVVSYGDGLYVISGELTEDQAKARFAIDSGLDPGTIQVSKDRVRWCLYNDDYDGSARNGWLLEARGRGSKPVWLFDRYLYDESRRAGLPEGMVSRE